jgi:hypothetical protein
MDQDVVLTASPPNYDYLPTYDFKVPVSFDWFGYVFPTFTALAVAGGTATQQIIIQADSDFEMRRIIFHADRALAAFTIATIPIPNYTIMLQDSGSGRNLFNAAVPLTSVAMHGAIGKPEGFGNLEWPKIFARNSTIVCQLTNFDAAVADYNVRIVLLGRKIYNYGQ